MKKIIALVAILFATSANADMRPGERINVLGLPMSKVELTWQVLNVIDAGQTINIARRPDCFREVGFPTQALIGEHPSESKVYATMALYSVAFHYASKWLENKDTRNYQGDYNSPWHVARVTFNIILISSKLYTVVNNYNVGVKPWSGGGCPRDGGMTMGIQLPIGSNQ